MGISNAEIIASVKDSQKVQVAPNLLGVRRMHKEKLPIPEFLKEKKIKI